MHKMWSRTLRSRREIKVSLEVPDAINTLIALGMAIVCIEDDFPIEDPYLMLGNKD